MLKFRLNALNYKVPEQFKRESWNLQFPITTNWSKAKQRILIVIDHVPSDDLRNQQLLHDESQTLFLNVLDRAHKVSKIWGNNTPITDYGFFFVSYSYFKTYDLDKTNMRLASQYNRERMDRIIKKFDPTHVHFFGEEIAKEYYDIDIEHRGWVIEKDGRSVSSNISITNASSSDDFDSDDSLGVESANLLGYASENLARLLNGSYPFSLRHLKPNHVLLDTYDKWQKIYKALLKAPCFAYDTETFNLSVLHNGLVTAQFTLPQKPDISYVLPLKCVSSKWTPKEFVQIYADLRKLFARRFDHEDWNIPYIIGQNIGFDLRVTRVELGIPLIYYRVWDTIAGEHALDENIKSITTKTLNKSDGDESEKNRPWSLDNILTRYENDFYYTAEFGKENRATIKDLELTQPVLEYMAMDTISIYNIHLMQKKRADLVKVNGESYKQDYCKLVLGVYSDTVHTMSHMVQNGLQTDFDYVVKQFAKDTSDIEKERDKLIQQLYKMPAVIQANEALLEDASIPEDGLFAGTEFENEGKWLFDITKQDHQQLLFFDIMELEPIETTATGKPSIGKAFLKAYTKEGSNSFREEVKIYAAITESTKVRGYIKNYFEKLSEPDGSTDHRIHAGYGYAGVVTGRSNSFGPSLQQTPNHGQYAKLIKRAFRALRGSVKVPDAFHQVTSGLVNVKMDYSAHEVGCWCIVSKDTNLARTFKKIWNTKVEYRKNPTPENKEKIELADAHKLNYETFTGTPIEEITKPQRQSSKAITFGAIYGKHVRSMAFDLGIPVDEMEKIFNRFFGKFKRAKKWLDNMVASSRKNFFVKNPFGFMRHLYGYMTGNYGISGAMDRRAMNSPIQGFASQIGFVAIRLLAVKMTDAFYDLNLYSEPVWDKQKSRFTVVEPPFKINAMVHDSTEVECSYELLPLVTQAMEHCATNGMMDYTNKMYGLEWIIRPQVDFEIGVTGDTFKGWDYSRASFKEAVQNTVKVKKSLGEKISIAEAKLALKSTAIVKKLRKRFPLDLSMYEID